MLRRQQTGHGIATPRGGSIVHRHRLLGTRRRNLFASTILLIVVYIIWCRLPREYNNYSTTTTSLSNLAILNNNDTTPSTTTTTTTTTFLPTIYFIITTSLKTTEGETNVMKRKQQYHNGIMSIYNATKTLFSSTTTTSYQIIIVENNGYRSTYLNNYKSMGIKVIYTNNNNKNLEKGIKELMDIKECINQFNMNPKLDFIVKMTGRYYLDNSNGMTPFFQLIRQEILTSTTTTKAIVKFGSYNEPSNIPMNDCITGLILLPVDLFLQMPMGCDNTYKSGNPIEWTYAKCILNTLSTTNRQEEQNEQQQQQFHAIQGNMGLWIAPAGSKYRLV